MFSADFPEQKRREKKTSINAECSTYILILAACFDLLICVKFIYLFFLLFLTNCDLDCERTPGFETTSRAGAE